MKKIFKLLSVLLICILLMSLFACSNTEDAYIYFELPSVPKTLDPQIASTDSELIIIKNIHEGLMRKNDKSETVCALAESYKINGLNYTFKLKSDAKWNNGEKITAYDFEFAFKRAVSPETKAPFAARLFAIKNAKKINNGILTSDKLAVKAKDNHTLTIELEYPDQYFLDTLTTSIAMPCNKEFFYESEGKYGLFADNILSSGSYELTRWRKETFGIRLYKNEEYNGFATANNSAVFLTCDNKKSVIEKLEKNSIDLAFVDCSKKNEIEQLDLKTLNIENICWVLTLGNNFSPDMRKAFSMLVDAQVFSNDLPNGYKSATSIFPAGIAKNATATGLSPYNPDVAKSLYLNEISKLPDNKFPSDIYLYYYDDGNVKNIVTDIVGHWQNKLSAFVNIKAVSNPEDLEDQLIEKTYPMAIFPVKADSKNLFEYLDKFGYRPVNNDLSAIQTDVLKSNQIVPILFQNTQIAYSKALSNVITETGNGYIDFSFIIKNE